MRRVVVYRPMTEDERTMALALGPMRVTYLPATLSERFGRDISSAAETTGEITERQAACLRRQVWTYRRQLPEAVRALVPEKPL
jgi:hypothetical protein